MSFAADHLLDRLRLKRRLRLWQGIGIVAIVAALFALAARFELMGAQEHIARIWIEGIIQDDAERDMVLRDLAEDDSVRAVVVRINSPGGTVVGGEALYRQLRMLSERKPVVAVMGEVAASAGYMTAIAADYVVAREGTITGSIGVLMQSANFTKLMDKIGVEPVVIKSSPLKAVPNPMEAVTPEAKEATQAVIMDMYDMFVGMVAERREMTLEQTLKIADGRVYTGRQAKENGLVDATGSEEIAYKWLETEKEIPPGLDVFDVEYGEEDFWMTAKSTLLSGIFDKTLISEGLRLDGLVSIWQPNLQ